MTAAPSSNLGDGKTGAARFKQRFSPLSTAAQTRFDSPRFLRFPQIHRRPAAPNAESPGSPPFFPHSTGKVSTSFHFLNTPRKRRVENPPVFHSARTARKIPLSPRRAPPAGSFSAISTAPTAPTVFYISFSLKTYRSPPGAPHFSSSVPASVFGPPVLRSLIQNGNIRAVSLFLPVFFPRFLTTSFREGRV